jgi:predicted RNA binding protein YcfA (HicA-like mRNA interferase family)
VFDRLPEGLRVNAGAEWLGFWLAAYLNRPLRRFRRSREVMNRLRRENWTERAGKGAHVVLSKDGRTVAVSNHAGDIRPGTLRSIRRGAGWEYPPQR